VTSCLQAVLESIRDSLNEQLVIPEWLVDIFLGYGDAGAAHYTQMSGLIKTVDFKVGWGASPLYIRARWYGCCHLLCLVVVCVCVCVGGGGRALCSCLALVWCVYVF
jgi:hypothetical protein